MAAAPALMTVPPVQALAMEASVQVLPAVFLESEPLPRETGPVMVPFAPLSP